MIEDVYQGLYARHADSKYVTSRMLDQPLSKKESNFSLEFKVMQEGGQSCGDAAISLFGNEHHTSEGSRLKQNRLTVESPYVLRFGTRKCKSIAYFQVAFRSALDGQMRELSDLVFAPLDRGQHTYRLNWTAMSDNHEILQENHLVSAGKISEDFQVVGKSEKDIFDHVSE